MKENKTIAAIAAILCIGLVSLVVIAQPWGGNVKKAALAAPPPPAVEEFEKCEGIYWMSLGGVTKSLMVATDDTLGGDTTTSFHLDLDKPGEPDYGRKDATYGHQAGTLEYTDDYKANFVLTYLGADASSEVARQNGKVDNATCIFGDIEFTPDCEAIVQDGSANVTIQLCSVENGPCCANPWLNYSRPIGEGNRVKPQVP